MTIVPPCLGCGGGGVVSSVASSAASSSAASSSVASSSAAGSSSLAADAEAVLDPLSVLSESLLPHAAANNDSTASNESTLIHRFNILFSPRTLGVEGVSGED
ncbi:MAG: hypothetical protein VX823_09610 [Actinomycetota bacterium]|nr:hypothetical protein [Actinomycetota bacterium]